MKLADALVATLRDWDLEYLFGVGGANIEHVYDAAHRLGGDRFQVICAKTETGAAFMADCRARTHRTLGLCCATSGGGMMNLAVGVAESFAEAIPVLAIVGQPPTPLHGRGAFQDSSGLGRTVNAEQLWGAIAKYQATIRSPEQFWSCLHEAVSAALSGRQGPAVLLIPRDLYECEVGPRPDWLPECIQDYSPKNAVSENEVETLLEAIVHAKSPVLLLGPNAGREAAAQFARRIGVQVATTIASKNAFPFDDPLMLGMAGVAGQPSVHRFLKERADLIVAVGTDLGAMTMQPIKDALQSHRLAAVHFDLSELRRVAAPRVAIEGDPEQVFAQLLRRCDERDLVPRKPAKAVASRFVARPATPLDFPSTNDHLLQSEALEILQPFLETFVAHGNVVFDAGNCAAAALHYLDLPHGAGAAIALGMGGMGYAVPAAIGAQLGAGPNARTAVICGDGAFLMLGAEVNTAVQYDLPILFVVFNNNMHGMCVTRQQLYFDGRVEGAQYPSTSIATMARGLGSTDRLWIGSAGTADEMVAQLTQFQKRRGPGVLELRLRHEEMPPFTPFLPSDAPTYIAHAGAPIHPPMDGFDLPLPHVAVA
jgi:acetolactate synthase-1/2/3 large subunit